MIKQKMFCLLAAGALLSTTGCHCLSSVLCGQGACGGSAGYSPVGYGEAGGCGGCESGCDSCARPCFPLLGKIFNGLQSIKQCIFYHGCAGGCSGCGEKYTSEWHNDPPGCADPCDGCGNWTGCRGGVYQAPYNVTPYAQPQGVPTEAPEPPAAQAGYRTYQQSPTMAPAGYRTNRHPGRISVGI